MARRALHSSTDALSYSLSYRVHTYDNESTQRVRGTYVYTNALALAGAVSCLE